MAIKEGSWVVIPAGTKICTTMLPIPRQYYTNSTLKEDTLSKVKWVLGGYTSNGILAFDDFSTPISDDIKPYKWPTLPKEKSNLLTKGSVWEVTKDIIAIVGKDSRSSITKFVFAHDPRIITISAGTRVEVTGKAAIAHGLWDEKSIPVKLLNSDETFNWIFVKAFAGMELVKEGKTKTYWKLEDSSGSPITPKRFQNLGNVKSSVRYHTGQMDSVYEEHEIAYWLETGQIKTFDDWRAVHYDMNNKVLEVVELKDWFILHKLQGKK